MTLDRIVALLKLLLPDWTMEELFDKAEGMLRGKLSQEQLNDFTMLRAAALRAEGTEE